MTPTCTTASPQTVLAAHPARHTIEDRYWSEPHHTLSLGYDQLYSTLGFQPLGWEKQLRAYFLQLLSETYSFATRETDHWQTLRNHYSKQRQAAAFGKKKESASVVSADAREDSHDSQLKKLCSRVEVYRAEVRTEGYSRRFIGKNYRYPLTLSLLSIQKTRLVGVKASFYHGDTAREVNAFMPLSILDCLGPAPDKYIENYQRIFRAGAQDISFYHITVSEDFKFTLRRHREDKAALRFDVHKVVPFELAIAWHDELIASKNVVGTPVPQFLALQPRTLSQLSSRSLVRSQASIK